MNSARKRPRPDDASVEFSPAATFTGSRPGFVFGTRAQGTGYYRDTSHTPPPAVAKKASRGVRIAEEYNETRTYTPVVEQPPDGATLLAAAEVSASGRRVLPHAPAALRASVAAWTKAVQENELLRVQYVADPAQYMESEVALYEHVQGWKALAADPANLYPVLLATEDVAASLLAPLLQHANTDVSRATIALLLEWLDATLLVKDDEDGSVVLVEPVLHLASLVLEEGLVDLCVANLGRLAAEESASSTSNTETTADDEVGKGVWDILNLVENLMDMETSTLPTVDEAPRATLRADGRSLVESLCAETALLGWLWAQVASDGDTPSPYRARALEVLAVVAPVEEVYTAVPDWTQIPPYSSTMLTEEDEDVKPAAVPAKPVATVDALEILLQTIGAYRKKQPAPDEVDLLENACMVMRSALTYSRTNWQAFLEAQGVQLVARCLKEGVYAGGLALGWLDVPGTDHAVYRQACEGMIAAQLIKYLMPLWMGRSLPASVHVTAKAQKTWKQSMEQGTIRVLYAWTRHLTADSPEDAQARLVAKFVRDPLKLDRLVHYLMAYDQKARTAEYKFYRSDVEEQLGNEESVQLAALDAKLQGGGDLFHRLGAIAAFLCVSSKECHQQILQKLQAKDSGMGLVRVALEEFASVLDDSPQRQQIEGYLEAL
jgi:beta-catenin-like protein 1